jgi:hypothetical protein
MIILAVMRGLRAAQQSTAAGYQDQQFAGVELALAPRAASIALGGGAKRHPLII